MSGDMCILNDSMNHTAYLCIGNAAFFVFILVILSLNGKVNLKEKEDSYKTQP